MIPTPSPYPPALKEAVIARALDHGETPLSVLKRLRAGKLEGWPATPVSNTTGYGWVRAAQRQRDAATPLTDTSLDDYIRRIWALALADLRLLERDAAKGRSPDIKRLNDLEALAVKLRRYLATRDDTDQPADQGRDDDPPSLLHTLASTDTAAPRPADTDPHTNTQTMAADREQPTVAPERTTKERVLSPAH